VEGGGRGGGGGRRDEDDDDDDDDDDSLLVRGDMRVGARGLGRVWKGPWPREEAKISWIDECSMFM
jgi:hypothetical protein